MTIVYPSSGIACRWNGALQMRLNRAPLEAFLKSRGLNPARRGAAQDTDDLSRAAVQIIETSLATVIARQASGTVPLFPGTAVIGHLACIVTKALAKLIEKPDTWRIAALLSTAQLLRPWMSLANAAVASASCVRQFEKKHASESATDSQIAQAAVSVVRNDGTADFEVVSAYIISSLSGCQLDCSNDPVARIEASTG